MNRFRQFNVRTILLLTAIVGVLCAVLAARMETVRRYNRGHLAAVQAVDVVLLREAAAPTSLGGRENYASGISRGRLFMSVTDDETFQLEVTARESRLFFGEAVVTVATEDFVGDRSLDAERNRQLHEAIVQRLKLNGVVVTQRDE